MAEPDRDLHRHPAVGRGSDVLHVGRGEHHDPGPVKPGHRGQLGGVLILVVAAVVGRHLRVDHPAPLPDATAHGSGRGNQHAVGEPPHEHRQPMAVLGADLELGGAQYSIPFRAPMPCWYACLTTVISVTVSASSTSSTGASRPVITTFVFGQRRSMPCTISPTGTQP